MATREELLARSDTAEKRSLAEIIEAIVKDIQHIIRAEIRLARRELTEKTARVKNASIFLAGAACAGFLGAACFVTACIAALAVALPLWLAALVMAIVCCGIALGGFILGRSRLGRIDPVPQQTVRTVKENLEWAKQRAS